MNTEESNQKWIKVDREKLETDPKSIIKDIFTEKVYLEDDWVNQHGDSEDDIPPYQEWLDAATCEFGEEFGHQAVFLTLWDEPDNWKREERIWINGQPSAYKYTDPFGMHTLTFDVMTKDGDTYVNSNYYLEG